ncbi:hypothetical protein [Streptomyces sp. CRN 30]|uniref:hypothetical protein n=1 Tax=Streptomyces sp. CRN 30 TaxID=3075613 RepID=UPI002A7F550D|nr:hypothetical protein [Streptomyces sp. CRN 30]
METDASALGDHHSPTPAEARAALADIERVRASTAARSATPWPLWFTALLTVYLASLPVVYGGVVAEGAWLLPEAAWWAVFVAMIAVFMASFVYAARSWVQRTGVALRLDILPKWVTVTLMIVAPALVVGSAWAFRFTGQVAWLIGAAAVGAALSIGSHLAFVRLHRERGQASS